MFDLEFTLVLIVIAAVLWYFQSWRAETKFGSLPHVPGSLPILGHLPFFGKYSHQTFAAWSKKYGNIFRIQLGQRPAVVVNGQADIKMISNMIESAGRPTLMSWEILQSQFGFDYSNNGLKYRKKSIHALSAVKNYNFDDDAKLFCEDMVDKWMKNGGVITAVHHDITLANCNLMFKYCYGRAQTEQDEKDIITLSDIGERFGQTIHAINMIDSFPWLLKIHPNLKKLYEDYLKGVNINIGISVRKIEENIQEAEDEDFHAARSLLDALRTVPTANTDGTMLDRKAVMLQIQVLFGAAIDTVAATVTWCVILLCKYPQYQADIWEEIKNETDVSGSISEHHLSGLVKLQAFINEVLRYVTPLPFSIPHCAIADIELKSSMVIPKDTFIFINLWSVNHDDKLWTTPEEFQPARFIVDGNLDKSKTKNIMSFSHGRRRCVGELLSQKVVSLFVANLLQKCEFGFAEDSKDINLSDVQMSLTLRPPPATVIVKQRLSGPA